MTQMMYETAIKSSKDTMQMGMTKFMMSLLGWIGFPLLGISWVENMDNIKSSIIFIVSLCMVLTRFYFWIRTAQRKAIREEQEQELRDLELTEKRREVRLSRPAGEEDEN